MVFIIETEGFQFCQSKFYIKELAIYDVTKNIICAHMLPSPPVKVFVKDSAAPEREAKRQITFLEQRIHGIKWDYNPQNLKNARVLLREVSRNLQNLDNERFYTKGEYKAKMLSKILKVTVENLDEILPAGVDQRITFSSTSSRVTRCHFDHTAKLGSVLRPDCAVIKAQYYGLMYSMLEETEWLYSDLCGLCINICTIIITRLLNGTWNESNGFWVSWTWVDPAAAQLVQWLYVLIWSNQS